MHFEHLFRLRQSKSKSGVKGWGWEGGGGGGVKERRRESKLQEPRLLHFAPYFNYPSCHFNDHSELGVRFSRGRFRLRGCGRSKQKTASHQYHATKK